MNFIFSTKIDLSTKMTLNKNLSNCPLIRELEKILRNKKIHFSQFVNLFYVEHENYRHRK